MELDSRYPGEETDGGVFGSGRPMSEGETCGAYMPQTWGLSYMTIESGIDQNKASGRLESK